MTERELLIELLAIKLYEHDCLREGMTPTWTDQCDEDRATYRSKVSSAQGIVGLYDDE